MKILYVNDRPLDGRYRVLVGDRVELWDMERIRAAEREGYFLQPMDTEGGGGATDQSGHVPASD